jgi:AcrR family transcriptional regulator
VKLAQTTTPAGSGAPEEQSLIDSVTEPGPGLPGTPAIETDEPDPDGQHPDDAPLPSAATTTTSTSTKTETKADTRERILNVALDLFTRQGFDGTSLRQIAESLGLTKAALYYHFESKDDILLALHMRMHEFGREALLKMRNDGPITLQQWSELLDEVVDITLTQRPLFLMHERNQAALEKLHREEHDAEHEDLQNQFRLVLADTRIPIEDRVRMSASFGVLFSGLVLAGDAFSSMTDEELGGLLRQILHDVLGG